MKPDRYEYRILYTDAQTGKKETVMVHNKDQVDYFISDLVIGGVDINTIEVQEKTWKNVTPQFLDKEGNTAIIPDLRFKVVGPGGEESEIRADLKLTQGGGVSLTHKRKLPDSAYNGV